MGYPCARSAGALEGNLWAKSRRLVQSFGRIRSFDVHRRDADDYPSWGEPTWVEATEGQQVSGTAIGHPLLSDRDRVCNDVTLGPQGSVLLVTGSNMSGKSTMMRSVGLNISLAGIGASVCAQSFKLPTVELVTSIRVSDDVSQGVSFYMAELQRLKSVVDHARELSKKDDRLCVFLWMKSCKEPIAESDRSLWCRCYST